MFSNSNPLEHDNSFTGNEASHWFLFGILLNPIYKHFERKKLSWMRQAIIFVTEKK